MFSLRSVSFRLNAKFFFPPLLPFRMDHAMEMLTLIYSITFYSVILITRLDFEA